jgi:hypothetical protein
MTFDEMIEEAEQSNPPSRGKRSRISRQRRDIIQNNLTRLTDVLNDQAVKSLGGSPISIVRAYLSCDPQQRTPEFFANVLELGLNQGSIKIRWLKKSPSELSQMIKDDWFEHCIKTGNEALANSFNSHRDMGFINLLLYHRRYAKMSIVLDNAPQTSP